jgi:hypothetical protein
MLATMLPSHDSDGATEATWSQHDVEAESCWRQCCRGDLAAARYRCRLMPVSMLPSHDGDGAAEATWSWRAIDVESY